MTQTGWDARVTPSDSTLRTTLKWAWRAHGVGLGGDQWSRSWSMLDSLRITSCVDLRRKMSSHDKHQFRPCFDGRSESVSSIIFKLVPPGAGVAGEATDCDVELLVFVVVSLVKVISHVPRPIQEFIVIPRKMLTMPLWNLTCHINNPSRAKEKTKTKQQKTKKKSNYQDITTVRQG